MEEGPENEEVPGDVADATEKTDTAAEETADIAAENPPEEVTNESHELEEPAPAETGELQESAEAGNNELVVAGTQENPEEGHEVEAPGEGHEVEAPGEGHEVEASREGYEVEASRDGYEVEAPREEYEVEAPREGYEVEAPGEGYEVEAPREGYEVEAPGEGYEGEAPEEGYEGEAPGEGYEVEAPGEGYEGEAPEERFAVEALENQDEEQPRIASSQDAFQEMEPVVNIPTGEEELEADVSQEGPPEFPDGERPEGAVDTEALDAAAGDETSKPIVKEMKVFVGKEEFAMKSKFPLKPRVRTAEVMYKAAARVIQDPTLPINLRPCYEFILGSSVRGAKGGSNRQMHEQNRRNLIQYKDTCKNEWEPNPTRTVPMIARRYGSKSGIKAIPRVEEWKILEERDKDRRDHELALELGYETLVGNLMHIDIPGGRDINRSWQNFLSEDTMEWGFPYEKGSFERPRMKQPEPYLAHQMAEKLWKFPRSRTFQTTQEE